MAAFFYINLNELYLEKRPLSTRLTFDESFTEDVNKSKVPKLNRDPFDSIAG